MEKLEFNWVEILDQLRKRIMISALAFFAFLVLGLVLVKDIFRFFLAGLDSKLMILGPNEIIWIYFHIASIVALIGTIPFVVWQIWLLLSPALPPNIRKFTISFIPTSFILFLGGLAFSYYLIFPNIMRFITNLTTDLMSASYTVDKYFSFLITMTLPFGIAFELPIIFMFITSLGIMNPYRMNKFRKYIYFVLVIIAAMISPPEIISNISVTIPLILLYELSILLSKMVYKKRVLVTDVATNLI